MSCVLPMYYERFLMRRRRISVIRLVDPTSDSTFGAPSFRAPSFRAPSCWLTFLLACIPLAHMLLSLLSGMPAMLPLCSRHSLRLSPDLLFVSRVMQAIYPTRSAVE